MNHHQNDPTVLTGEYHISDGLTSTITRTSFSSFQQLQQAANSVLETLQATGNQWILISGLPKEAIERLDNDKECLGGVDFRFEWEGSTGLIKVIPGFTHESLINDVTAKIASDLQDMGIHWSERRWIGTTTYKPAVSKGKQADQGFTPPSRRGAQGQTQGWPTLVIEVGVSESAAKLHSDAKFWFNSSDGQTRIMIVILVSAKRGRVTFEKWMLMPPNAPNPLAQEVVITQTGVTGAPMILPFEVLYDRQPTANETDITITAEDFRKFVETIF